MLDLKVLEHHLQPNLNEGSKFPNPVEHPPSPWDLLLPSLIQVQHRKFSSSSPATNLAPSATPPPAGALHKASPAPSGQAPQATVPVRRIFDRILSTPPSMTAVEDNSIAAVEKALVRIELAAEQEPTVQVQVPQPTSPLCLCNFEHHAKQRFNELLPAASSTPHEATIFSCSSPGQR
jgi:hypothetical protein